MADSVSAQESMIQNGRKLALKLLSSVHVQVSMSGERESNEAGNLSIGGIESKPEPLHPEERADDRAGVHHTAGVGYESTRVNTPNGKESTHGVIFSTGTSVGIGAGGRRSGPDDRKQRVAETELRAKGLPEGQLAAPVAGYLYFPLPSKKDKKSERQLEYWVNGERVVLALP